MPAQHRELNRSDVEREAVRATSVDMAWTSGAGYDTTGIHGCLVVPLGPEDE